MTFLFSDIEGSTREWERSPAMHGQVDLHFRILRHAVEEHGGEVFATMGDGIAAAFPSAESAVQAAISSQLQMPSVGLDVRIGLHTGEAHRVDRDFRGRAVNRAARIMSIGHGGQILASNVTAAIIRNGPATIDFADLGIHRLRDITEPERVWQVTHPDLVEWFPPLRSETGASHNLPASRTPMIGRDRDAARIADLSRDHRLVTLTGVGGVGKTRLAVRTATDLLSRFGRIWFVTLADVADSADVAATIARVLGGGTATDPLVAATAILRTEPALLIVDNCEHVIERAAATIDALVTSCPELTVIATSREALGVDGECVARVRPLDPASTALELFEQRAQAAGLPRGDIDAGQVEYLCRRLDGLPLAIELAAAHAAALGTASVIRSLDDRLGLLHRERRSSERHGTMRATIDWSYRLLDEQEQRLFRRLAVFSNGFELDAVVDIARSIGSSPAQTTQSVTSLVVKSMIALESGPYGVRHHLLETVRAFAIEQLHEHDEFTSASDAHAQWLTSLTDLTVHDPCTAEVERNAIRLEREADNWRDAMIYAATIGSSDLARRLCGPPAQFFLLGRHDLADVVRPVLELCDDDLGARQSVLCALCVSGAAGADPAKLADWSSEVQRLDEADPTGLGPLMSWLRHAWTGDFVGAVDVCVRASTDRRLSQSTRDMFVAIAVLDHFSLTDATTDTYGLIDAALEVADRSDVALQRVSCRLGAAWGVAASDPERSLHLIRRAMDDMAYVPALTRSTLPGNASRLLARLDPRFAAEGLLAQLDAAATCPSFVDLIPVSYASALLHRVAHPSAQVTLETLTVSSAAPHLSMMDAIDLARRTSADENPVSIRELESIIRAGLEDIVAGRFAPV